MHDAQIPSERDHASAAELDDVYSYIYIYSIYIYILTNIYLLFTGVQKQYGREDR